MITTLTKVAQSIIIFNYAILKYYTDPHESVTLALWIQVMAFSSVMVYILLIPFDVFASVRHFTTVVNFKVPILGTTHEVTIYDLYFICYITMIYMTFIGLPFSYFYAQSVQDEEEMALNAGTILKSGGDMKATPDMKECLESSESSEEEEKKEEHEAQDIDIELSGEKGESNKSAKPYKRK